MREAFGENLELAGRCYHDLFRGEDTDEAEAAAQHMAEVMEMIKRSLTKR